MLGLMLGLVLLVGAGVGLIATGVLSSSGKASAHPKTNNSSVLPRSVQPRSSTTLSTSTSTTAPSTELAEGQSIGLIIGQSAQARSNVEGAVSAIGNCGDISGAISTLQSDAALHQTDLSQLNTTVVSAIPGGQTVQMDLAQALQQSALSDQDYADWGNDVSGCSGTAPQTSNWAAAQAADQQASAAKQAFTAAWNPVAQQLGLPTQDPNQI